MIQTIQLILQKDNANLIDKLLISNQSTKVTAEQGMRFSLLDAKTGQPAKKLKAKKSANDLLIADENGDTLLTIEDYYITDDVQLGTVSDSGFSEFDYVGSETGVISQVALETSYTTLVSEMSGGTSIINGVSNTVLLGSLGAAALGAVAFSGGSSSSSKQPVNDLPVSKDSIVTATEDTVVNGKLEAATDADGDALSYAIATNAVNGKVVIDKDGSYSYTPNANFNGKDSFTYTINDGKGGVITQTATVNVAAVNDAPVSANTTIAATEDTVAKGLLAKATDVDGDALTYTLASGTANGKVTIGKDGSYTYTPNANFNGKDSFTYTVTDGTETITKTANITVASVNDIPVSKDSTVTATEDTAVNGKLEAATDADDDNLTYALKDTAANGTVVVNADGSYSYAPNADFNGSDSFTYSIDDGQGGVITQTATITVAAVNDVPVAEDSIITAIEDTVATGQLATATDVDDDTLTFALVSSTTNGSVIVNADGSYSYTPNANFNGSDGFTYTVTDGTETITKTATITVASVNDLPVSTDNIIAATEDTSTEGQLEAATDVDGDDLTYALDSDASNGTAVVNADGSYSYTPNANFNGKDSFTYTISDSKGGVITQTATVSVAAVNDTPVSANTTIAATEDTVATGQLAKATDVDGDALTYTIGTAAKNGTATVSTDGSYTYTPNANFNGKDSFTYTLTDGTETITKTANITVASVNDIPVSKDSIVTATEDTVVNGKLEAATDADGDALSYAIATNAVNGKVVIDKDGSYSYTPNANFNGKDSFTYTINDGKGGVITQTATVNVAAVNDAPVSANTTIAATEDTVAKGLLAKATDVDGDALTYTLASGTANGKVTIGKDGSYTYTPNANFNGKDSFTYTVTDGTETITKTANITVASVNDIPVSKDSTVTATEDTAVNGKLEAATDADDDNLTYALKDTAANGTVVVNADGSYSYAPNADFNGSDSFTYSIDDGQGGVITQTATITVAAVNDVPVAEDSIITAIEDTVATGQLATATDVDDDTLTFALVSSTTNGSVIVNADGSYSYTPNANFNGSDGFTYTVTDGTETITKTATITVASVNDLPVSTDNIIAATEDTSTEGQLEAATDVDGDDLTYALDSDASNGTAVVNADGSYSYTPNANFNGKDSFTYTISDSKGGVITQTATVSVAAVNDTPVSENSIIGVAENITDIGVLTEATDVDGDMLTYTLLTEAENGIVTVNANGSYTYTPNTDFTGEDNFTYTVNDGQGGLITKTANITVSSLDQKYNFELQEVFETSVINEQQIVVEKQALSFISELIEFEITGENGMPQLDISNSSNIINGYYFYELQGSGISASSSRSISSAGSRNYSIDFNIDTLPLGKYILDLYVESRGSSIDFNVTQFKDVESINFAGYQNVTGNIFTDDDGSIGTPKNYEIQVDGQSLVFQTDTAADSPITIDTDNGKLTIAANGSYIYSSDRNDLGLETENLTEDFYVKVIDLDTQQASHYGVNITSDTTPPESGELVLNNFEDTGISKDDGVTQDNTFDLTIKNNETDSQVKYQYSTDHGATWAVLVNGEASNLAGGDYSFRAKVTDEALNESFTAVKDITIDTTAPILGQILNFNTATNQLEVNADIDQDTLQAFKLENGTLVPLADVTNIPLVEGNYQIQASDVAGNSTTLDFIMSNASEYFESADVTDIVKGSAGNDYIYGGNGDDILISNGGLDHLYGESGNDTLIYGGNSSSLASLSGGEGDDTYIVDFQKLTATVSIADYDKLNKLNIEGVNPSELTLTRDNQYLVLSTENGEVRIYGQFTEDGVENIYFDDGTVWDRTTIDTLTGGKITGTDGDDVLTLDSDNSVLYGGNGNDTLTGSINNDYIYGGNGDDILISNGGLDHLYGESGNDTLIYGGNSSSLASLSGGEGDDTYIVDFQKLTATVSIADYDKLNKLNIEGVNPSELTLTRDNQYLVLSTENGEVRIYGQFTEDGVENIYFDDGTVWDRTTIDTLTGGKITGTDGDDVLTLDSDNSVLYGGNGNDTLTGSINNDYIYGGNGDDILISNGGLDHLYGESGNDTLIYGGNSSSLASLSGGEGDDTYIVDFQKLTATVSIADYDKLNKLNIEGVNPSELTLTRDNQYLVLSTENGEVRIYGQFTEDGVENIYFDDGTVWDRTTIDTLTGGSSARSLMSLGEAEEFNTEIDIFANSQQVKLPKIEDLLDVNNNELTFESADVLAKNTANETATTSVSSGASESSIAVDFTIVQALNDNMQTEAIFHIM
ncbi:tandem-95 repeat protein [Psychrobacter sp. P11G3]|uniref:tandem-95 repeat protein n=1 Tax=Psychrobacter sp. P11G3 TaxID=1699623 RepID=UPI00070CDE83|nr:Ig-like domain-containing protein [Psychrobacter sp. P11G3]